MKTVIDYLNDLKGKTGSDYATAKALHITKESVSKIRSRGQMSDGTALKMAELLNIEPDEILISAAIARNDGTVKAAWINHAKKAGIAATIAMVAIVNDGYLTENSTVNNIHYAKSMQTVAQFLR